MSESVSSEPTRDPRAELLTEFGKLRRQHELRLENPNPPYPPRKQVVSGKLADGYVRFFYLPPLPQYDALTYNSHLLTVLRMLRDDWHITFEQTATTTMTLTSFRFEPAGFHPGLHPNIAQEEFPPETFGPYPSLYDAVTGAVLYAIWYAENAD